MQAWDHFLNTLEITLGKKTVDRWLRTLKVQRFDAQNLYLQAQDTFQMLWFEEHVRQLCHKKLLNASDKPIHIHLTTHATPALPKGKVRKQGQKVDQERVTYTFAGLDPTCRFSTFLFDEQNILPQRLFQDVLGLDEGHEVHLQSPPDYNPIFIYGPRGSGKSHLLMAAAQVLREAQIKVLYSPLETFTDHLVTAIRSSDMSGFRKAWRSCDVLIVDDVQLLSKKTATQEEFFHTFNTLHTSGKQIILASDKTPQELRFIEPRLVSRFEWGITIPLKPLERLAFGKLLHKKIEALGLEIPARISAYLLDLFSSNPKSLVQALEALVLRTHLDHEEVSLQNMSQQSLKKILIDLVAEEERRLITPEKILAKVALHFGITHQDISGKGQTKDVLIPRKIAMYLCRDLLNLPYTKIGEYFGDRDHSTVMNAIRQVRKELDQNNPSMRADLLEVTQSIKLG